MTRRERSEPPRPGMKWSRRHPMWVDPDPPSRERSAKDEEILQQLESDQDRIRTLLRRAQESRDPSDVKEAATLLAERLLRSLVEARNRAGLSQAEVARRMGAPQPAIVRLEAGRHSPTLTTLARYASAIGVDLRAGEQV